MGIFGTTIFFTSDLSFEAITSKLGKTFNRAGSSRDDSNAWLFVLFGFYELLLSKCSSEFDKKGDLNMLTYVYIPDDPDLDIKSLEPVFNKYLNSIIVSNKIGIPVTRNKEVITVEKLTRLTGKVEFNSDKEIEGVIRVLQSCFRADFLPDGKVYKAQIFGLLLQLKPSETYEDQVKYILEIVDCEICKDNDCDEEDISLYLKNLIHETKAGV